MIKIVSLFGLVANGMLFGMTYVIHRVSPHPMDAVILLWAAVFIGVSYAGALRK